ncbi:MAG: hypothetical protein K0S27_1681 [Gammaproteobacteria bacterium]|jgi:hypothetical protein|nr:hypothetical protein [Gammaproteobacteria bacterium]
MSMLPKKFENYLSFSQRNFQKPNQLAFLARAMVIATFPHSEPRETLFKRKNGYYSLVMTANPEFGLPYGSTPRVLLAWLTTEAIRKRSPEIDLGKSLTQFLKKLKLQSGGGERGNTTRVRDQLLRLLTCHISCIYHNKNQGRCANDQFHISRSFALWWNPLEPGAKGFLPQSKIILAQDFFDEMIKNPIPVDFQALHFFRKSPLQMDLYVWLTYRFSFLKDQVFIPWELIKAQFGSDYADDAQGVRNFKKKFLQALKKVWLIYPAANVCPTPKGLTLFVSETHVQKKNQRFSNSVDNLSYSRCNGTA